MWLHIRCGHIFCYYCKIVSNILCLFNLGIIIYLNKSIFKISPVNILLAGLISFIITYSHPLVNKKRTEIKKFPGTIRSGIFLCSICRVTCRTAGLPDLPLCSGIPRRRTGRSGRPHPVLRSGR